MIEIVIPKDIRKYEAKLIGPFTMRQCVCFACSAVLGIVEYRALNPLVGTDLTIGIILASVLPFIVCGWVPIYGMPAEKFILSTFIGMFLAPKHRLYKVKNMYIKETRFKKMDEKSYKKRLKKEKKLAKTNPDYERIL